MSISVLLPLLSSLVPLCLSVIRPPFPIDRCKFAGGGGQYANTKGEISPTLNPLTDPPELDFPLWDSGAGGYVDSCYFPLKLVDENSGTQVCRP